MEYLNINLELIYYQNFLFLVSRNRNEIKKHKGRFKKKIASATDDICYNRLKYFHFHLTVP